VTYVYQSRTRAQASFRRKSGYLYPTCFREVCRNERGWFPLLGKTEVTVKTIEICKQPKDERLVPHNLGVIGRNRHLLDLVLIIDPDGPLAGITLQCQLNQVSLSSPDFLLFLAGDFKTH